MKTDVLIFEYFGDTSPISRILKRFTGKKYSHTAMMINNFFCELSPIDRREKEADYHIRLIQNKVFFLQKMKKKADIFSVPVEFSQKEKLRMIKFWQKKAFKRVRYGYNKLFLIFFLKPFLRRAKKYYKDNGEPMPLNWAEFWNRDTCSNAVDRCLRIGCYNIIPELDDRVAVPGMFADKLQNYKI
jgi:hypothetical protein